MAHGPMDKPTAWACTVTNLVTLPGLGTLAAGRKIGYVQAAVAAVGLVLVNVCAVLVLLDWRPGGEWDIAVIFHVGLGVVGLVCYGGAWFWGLASAIGLHRQVARRSAPAPASEPAKPPPPRLTAKG